MGRTTVVVDEDLVERVRRLYGLRTKRETIDFALRGLAGDDGKPWRAALALEGSGWVGDLDEMRSGRVVDL